MGVTLFDILGIDSNLTNPERIDIAADIWPSRRLHFLLGDFDTSTSVSPLMGYLQDALRFKSINPGATPESVGFYAEIEISNPAAPPPVPLVIRTMPDIAFFLQDTGVQRPARCYVTTKKNAVDGERKTEIVIEALPVEIRLPGGLLEPITEAQGGQPPAPLTNEFNAGIYDSFKVELRAADPSSLFVHLKIRVTEEWDFIVEPSVILSIGPCLFSGLPCFGLHDISFIAAPTLKGDHKKEEQAIEWTRHSIEPTESMLPGDTNFRGVLAVRTIDLDSSQTPLLELTELLNSGQPQTDQVQFVLEDVVIPFFNVLLLPIPIHGTLGIRRNIEFGDGFEEIFSFASAPIKIQLCGFAILIEEFIVESFDPNAIDESQVARIKIIITDGSIPETTSLAGSVNASDSHLNVEDASVFSNKKLPFIIDRTTPSKREIVNVLSISGNELEVERGFQGTTATGHEEGAVIEVDQFSGPAGTIAFTEEWTIQGGWRRNKGAVRFTIGGNKVKVMGAKLGFSLKRWHERNREPVDYKWYDYVQILVDLNLEMIPSTNKKFRIEFLSDESDGTEDATFLVAPIDATTTIISVEEPTVFDHIVFGEFWIIDHSDPENREVVMVIARIGDPEDNNLEVIRGQEGTSARAHPEGARIQLNDFAEQRAPVNIPWLNVGWNLGSLSIGGVQLPEGTQVVILDFLKIIIQEISIQTDKNGGTYFLVSGGLAAASERYAASINVYRFQWRIAGNKTAPQWQLGGISFALKIKTFELSGTGMAAEFNLNDHLYKELQFALDLKFKAFNKKFGLGLSLYKGEVSGRIDNFKYWMFGFKLAYIPVSGLDLYNLRVMAAHNLAPNLEAPDSSDQNLRVFKWYKNATTPLSIPTDKKNDAWFPLKDSFALGIGMAGGVGGTKSLLLDMFVFGHNSPSEKGFMIAMELFLLKSQKPIGFGVLEVDLERDKWALFVGVSLSFSNIGPEGVSIPGIAALSGNLYIGNKPSTFALGQLSDQNTWLGFRLKENGLFNMELIIAVCIQYVCREKGPKGFGGLISAKGGTSFGVGDAQFYVNFLFIAGTWKNESSTSGIIILFEAGFRIKLFRFFQFGASIKVQLDFLGPNPKYRRMAFEISIDTPWYLPDVTIRFERVSSLPKPEEQSSSSICIISAEAFSAGVKLPGPVLLTTLDGAAMDERRLYSLKELRSMVPQQLGQSELEEMEAIGVDSTIVLNFKPPVDDKLTVGTNTPEGAGTQRAIAPAKSQLSFTYELISLSIRRQPRYGSNANQWSSLLAPEQTQMPGLEDWPEGEQLEAQFTSEVTFLWDSDVRSEGRLDPRRLLINANTPFTLLTENDEVDESILVNHPGWPCCFPSGRAKQEKWHRINYNHIQSGQRVSQFQTFTDSNSTLNWLLDTNPLVAPSQMTNVPSKCVKVNLKNPQEFTFAVVNFDQPAFHFRMECYWLAQHRTASIILEAFHGIKLVSKQNISLATNHQGFLEMKETLGMTRIHLRFKSEGIENPIDRNLSQPLEVVRLEYRTVFEQRDLLSRLLQCRNAENALVTGKGKLAWLPNHNYEITATTKVILHQNQTGAQEATMVQKAYFRTKGMIGLNYVEHVGKEIEPYLDTIYPDTETTIIYRDEPIAMVFNEQFNILLPVDRNLDPENSTELNQILEWDLTVDKESDALGNNRISKSNPDWIIENRGTGATNPHDFAVLVGQIMLFVERKTPSSDTMQLRLEGIMASPFSCDGGSSALPKSSQVILHQPIDPSGQEPIHLWESNSLYRANLKAKGGPFIHRHPFEEDDVTSFKSFTEQGFEPNVWVFEEGTIHLEDTSSPTLRHYAIFGESDWDHVRLNLQLAPNGNLAGCAIGVHTELSGVTRALLVLLDERDGILRAIKWNEGQLQILKQTNIPENLTSPYQLDLIAYDDQLQICLDDTKIIVKRDNIRAGQLALVGQGGATFMGLIVESLDAYQFHFQSSRFKDFAQHIQSVGDKIDIIPALSEGEGEMTLIQELYDLTAPNIINLMRQDSDSRQRQNLFMRWTESLALPLIQYSQKLTISSFQKEDNSLLLLIEGPESLRFSSEVGLTVHREITNADPLPNTPSLEVLESRFPRDLGVFELTIPALISEVKSLDIQPNKMVVVIPTHLLQSLTQASRYALLSFNHEGKLKYFFMELNFSRINQIFTRIQGRIRDNQTFSNSQQPFIQAITTQIQNIQANQLFLINKQGALIKTIFLPELSLPFFEQQYFSLLSNGNETRTILIPLTSENGTPTHWTRGKYIFHFELNRQRYLQDVPDTNSLYSKEVELEFVL